MFTANASEKSELDFGIKTLIRDPANRYHGRMSLRAATLLFVLILGAIALIPHAPEARADDRGVGLPCDLNFDGIANAVDVSIFVNKLLGMTPPTPFDPADVNNDGLIDGRDIRPFVCCIVGSFC